MNHALKVRLLFSLLMSLCMSALMCGWVTWLNLGLSADYLARWGHAFVHAWPAAFTVVLLLAPTLQRLTHYLLRTHTVIKGV
ncbi:DUF2798 domain-containing protein [Paludibacterium sp. B53371]|uniref:DUF2798 domain-containing protein n=1 Tax=Paludibacterium sp. B53371 TaxID=2806263 RepID=UPI001C03EF5E|nr:DUF2798 domain-containing protein [Paludibacterium sp. B53371]